MPQQRSDLGHAETVPIADARDSPDPWSVTLAASAAPGPAEPTGLPTQLGRYVGLSLVGTGGMGAVFVARDPVLDRQVALKLLNPGIEYAFSRLAREAKAMARLAHPNVVQVYDLGIHGQSVYLTMEYVQGRTLRDWMNEGRRTWQEVLDVLLLAARGLAAAHRAGLVHRDFKPSNVLMSGAVVKVADFGLARLAAGSDVEDAEPGSARPAISASQNAVTATIGGVLLGTPAYMAPEQWWKTEVDGRSDQFSFCVVLYEALYGHYPFASGTTQAVAESASLADLQPASTAVTVPSWLRAAVMRGMSVDPGERHPSMDALVHILERGRSRSRRVILLLVVAGLIAATLALLLVADQDAPERACDGGAKEMGAVWNDPLRDELAGHFASFGNYYHSELWPLVRSAIEEYAAGWRLAHEHACLAHVRGEHSEEILDQRMQCLAQRRAGLSEALSVLRTGDSEIAVRGLDVVGGLRPVSDCNNLAMLAAATPLPADPSLRAWSTEQQSQLERVGVLERAGQPRAAIELADAAVRAAEERSHRPSLSQALLVRARVSMHFHARLEDDDAIMSRAFLTAFETGDDEAAAEALALRIYRRGREVGQSRQAREDIALARGFMARLPESTRVSGLIQNNVGAALMAMGDRDEAEAAFRQAVPLMTASLGPRHVYVGFAMSNLARLVSDAEESEEMVLRALEIVEAGLGPAHPASTAMRITTGGILRDPVAAAEVLAQGCTQLEKFAEEQIGRRVICLSHQARLEEEAGRGSVAVGTWKRAHALLPRLKRDDPELMAWDIAWVRCRAYQDQGATDEEIAALRASTGFDGEGEWWLGVPKAELKLCLGQVLLQRRAGAEARLLLKAADADLAASSANEPMRDVAIARLQQQIRLALAEALLESGDALDRQRASQELDAAEAWYRGAGIAFRWRLERIAELRAAHALR